MGATGAVGPTGPAGPAGPVDNLGNHNATTRIQPTVGNSAAAGIEWPNNPGGGAGDEAFLRYYIESGENTKLLIGVGDNPDDDIGFYQNAAERLTIYNGNVGINNTGPANTLDVNGSIRSYKADSGTAPNILLRANYTSAWGWKLATVDRGGGIDFDLWASDNVDTFTQIATFANYLTSGRQALQVMGDTRVGQTTAPGTAAGWGSALVLSGGQNLFPPYTGDNSDPVWLARYNASGNVTELRVIVGDDPGQAAEKFVVGAMSGVAEFSKGGAWSPKFSVGMDGVVRAAGSINANASPDLAETIPTDGNVEEADVVCPDEAHREQARRCKKGDTAVLGVIADDTSSFLINAHSGNIEGPLTGKPLVLAGRVPVKVSLENGPIAIGDFLTLSSTPGVAMRASGPGPVVGIALEAFDGKQGPTGKTLCFVKAGQGGIPELAAENARLRADYQSIQADNQSLKERVARLEKLIGESVAAKPAAAATQRK